MTLDYANVVTPTYGAHTFEKVNDNEYHLYLENSKAYSKGRSQLYMNERQYFQKGDIHKYLLLFDKPDSNLIKLVIGK